MGENWIRSLVEHYEKENLFFLAAPVKIIPDASWLSIFQTLDFISLQGITGAAVYKNLYPMCNGANLAYTRKVYDEVDGFADIDHIASGDDMLLMKKIQAKFPGRSGFIKDPSAIVSTILPVISGHFFISVSGGQVKFHIINIRQPLSRWPWCFYGECFACCFYLSAVFFTGTGDGSCFCWLLKPSLNIFLLLR